MKCWVSFHPEWYYFGWVKLEGAVWSQLSCTGNFDSGWRNSERAVYEVYYYNVLVILILGWENQKRWYEVYFCITLFIIRVCVPYVSAICDILQLVVYHYIDKEHSFCIMIIYSVYSILKTRLLCFYTFLIIIRGDH